MRAFSVTGFVVALAGAMMIAERLRPGRLWPKVAGWWPRALLLNGVQVLSVYVAGLTTDRWLGAHRPWSADALGLWGGAAVGYVVHTFVYYWWHRARHAVPLLWRWVHQVHHSPSRIEVVTSFYKHPVEIAINGVLSSVVLYVVVGLDAETGALVMAVNGVAELFYHWNVRTPRWLGFVVQRPESHCVHHQESLHRHNYADLPVFDMLFGTFRNPGAWAGSCGFSGDAETRRFGSMLLGRDVGRSERAP
jgi:sterol desaturase/sphingolipid hydroxylase (fatty acid hydroxylase superfamily)